MKQIKGSCPICGVKIISSGGLEESEIINCRECQSRLVVENINNNNAEFSEAPNIEEDWGE